MQAININPRRSPSCSSSSRVYGALPITHFRRPYAISILTEKYSKLPCFSQKFRLIKPCFARSNFTISCSSKSWRAVTPLESSGRTNSTEEDDFVSRVLKENPSQVEPRFKIGDKLYTSEEREKLRSNKFLVAAREYLRRLNDKEKIKGESRKESFHESEDKKLSEGGGESVYLKDILREHRGQLYVPEQLFRSSLSQEEEFNRLYETLPVMSYDEFVKFMNIDNVQLLTVKESGDEGDGVRHFIVDLNELPGEKSLHRTKWAMKLPGPEAELLLETYTGPLNEIETRATTWVGKAPEYVNPVAVSISSRVMVELAMVAAILFSATAIVGGFLASAVFAAASFVFATTVYVIWPVVNPLLRAFLILTIRAVQEIWCRAVEFVGDVIFFISQAYTLGGMTSSIIVLLPSVVVIGTFGILIRYMLARSPKDFKKWDIWQGLRFTQSKAEARVDGSTGVTFADVAGIDEAVGELLELVRYLKNPELFEQMGIKPPHGVLLEGPPGCGKTLVAKAIAGEAGVPFYQMAGSEFVQILVGVGSARIRDLFKRAKVNRPSVVFIDEIDALGTRREGMNNEEVKGRYNANTQERETTLNQLLIELDGFDTGKGVIFIGATNRKDLLDPALLRPGRFDRKIKVMPPNERGRFEVLKVHARKVHLDPSVDLSVYANNLPGWSGAKLAQLLQEAALVAARKGHESIMEPDMDEAVDRLTIGPVRLGLPLSQPGMLRIATTELGTAITSQLLRRLENANVEQCDRVSIRPRGETLSQLVYNRMNEESVVFQRRPTFLHRLQVFLGGRAAEDIVFGRDTSTASVQYLADATWLARKMITIWNMEGPMTIHGEPPAWRKMPEFTGPRLDFEGSLYRHYGLIEQPINFELDDEVCRRTENLLKETYTKTVKLLKTHEAALLKCIKVLTHKHELSGEEIDYIIERYSADTPVSVLLEERNPGSIEFFGEESEQGREIKYVTETASRE